ncbi:MAG: glutamate--cysteine ligase [Armatimonadota bacterium]
MAGDAEERELPGRLTLGVEEEYQIVDPETGELRSRASRVLRDARRELGEQVTTELHLSQVESATPVCETLDDVRAEVARHRRGLIEAAGRDGTRIIAAGTHPFSRPEHQMITPRERYQKLAADYQHLARDLIIFGCHVHVGLPDPGLGIEVLNRARLWLAPLLALSANSPFYRGEDTGYASFRTELWGQWPLSGPPQPFEDREDYESLIEGLVATRVIDDPSKIYWDIRLPARLPTVEFRVTDVCLGVDDAVMIAGLIRGLTRVCLEEARAGAPYRKARPELLKASMWMAARYGLTSELFDVEHCRRVLAVDLVEQLLERVRPGLEAEGDWEQVSGLVRRTLKHGNGAMRQREVFWRRNELLDTIAFAIQETARGTGAELPETEAGEAARAA